jgi:DNA modification methylase
MISEWCQLYHGDCLEVMPDIPDGSVDLVMADLPYGTTACQWDSVIPLEQLWVEYKRILKASGCVVLTSAQPFTWKLCASNPTWFRYELIWEKPNGTNPLLVKKQPFRCHENILVFSEKTTTYNPQMTRGTPYGGFTSDDKHIGEVYGTQKSQHRDNPTGERYPRSIQQFQQEKGLHPTQKPVVLMEYLIKTYTNENELVLDNTMGSGTTGVACMNTNRKFIGIEQDDKYFHLASDRIRKSSKHKQFFG